MKTRFTTALLAHTEAVRAWKEQPTPARADELEQTLEALARAALELESENQRLRTGGLAVES